MKINLVIFDLDGVLVDTKNIHYTTLNNAILLEAGKKFCIGYEEHLSIYDGLKTFPKLCVNRFAKSRTFLFRITLDRTS